MRRTRLALLACAAAAALAGPASGGPGLIVGVDDDSFKWANHAQAQATLGYTRDLGIRAVRITVPWRLGQTQLSAADRKPLDRAIVTSWGMRVVLAVYGYSDDTPQSDAERSGYCTFVANLLRRYPAVGDVVIWNEPNVSRFWRPQYAQDGSSAAPAAYEALLARCYDVIHAVRPGANVIAASSPRGNDRPSALNNVSHSPVSFFRGLGEAYRASGRRTPFFDVVGHNPYPDTNAERPWTRHPSSSSIGQGDYDKLMRTLEEAFGGTGQPLPGQGRVSIWYMEQGFQTTIDPEKRGLYRGSETDRHALPPWLGRGTAGATDGLAPDQASQLADSLRLASCQPAVGAFFNFELVDEPDLSGWQSGVLWADLTPKPSYQAFKDAVAEVARGSVDCTRYDALAAKGKLESGAGAEIGFTTKPEQSTKKPPAKKPPVVVVK